MLKNISKIFVLLILFFSFSALVAGEIHCNPDTKTCHKPTCRHYNCKGCTKVFQSEEEVVKNGYKFCKICAKEKADKKQGK